VLVFVEEGKLENLEKNPHSKARTINKLNPLMPPGPEYKPRPHWWEESTLTTVPSLLPMIIRMYSEVHKLQCTCPIIYLIYNLYNTYMVVLSQFGLHPPCTPPSSTTLPFLSEKGNPSVFLQHPSLKTNLPQ